MIQHKPIRFIHNILTLRYDPERSINGEKLSVSDFKPIGYKEDMAERVELLLKDEIKASLDKVKSIAIPMGSGIDSTLILTLTKELFPEKDIKATTISFNDSQDESEKALKICSLLGVECYKIVIDNVLKDLPYLISIVMEPRWNLWYYYVVEAAKRLGSEVVLTGDGGDELFGGYTFRYSKYLDLINSARDWVTRVWAYMQCHERDWVPEQHEIFGIKANKFKWENILRYFKPYFDNELDNLNQVFLADYNGKLTYDWIPTNTIFSNYFEIKTISPFLSKRVREYATHIPIDQKYDPQTQEGKLLLRRILEKYGILPYVSKTKIGFGMDLVCLWNRHGKKMVESLDCSMIINEGLINKEWLNNTIEKLKKVNEPRYINKILQIASLEIWLRILKNDDIQIIWE